MKKLIAVLLVLSLAFTAVFANGSKEQAAEPVKEETIYEKGQKMTDAELLELAKAEKGDFLVYGNTSRIANAVENFVAKYGADLGLTTDTAKGTKLSDSDIYTTLLQEYMGTGNKAASAVMIQDGAQLQTYRAGTDILVNFVPKAAGEVLEAADQNPLVQQYINKLFIWNNIGKDSQIITNAWQLTEPEWQGKIFFKSPAVEQVNMNFLVMCTSDTWAAKLADAYKEYYGKDVVLGSYKNAGYKWVAEFIANCNFSISSDTTICKTLAKAASQGCAGLFVLSKIRDVDASIKGNLTVGAFESQPISPFAGFMYPMYLQITKKTTRPYTAMLFASYLMSEEGFQPWGKDMGAYSTIPTVKVNEGDQPITFWKSCLVAEDAEFIRINKTSVQDFVNAAIAAKK